MNPTCPFTASLHTLEDLVSRWEQGSLPKAEWTHAAHIAVASYYAALHGELATAMMRTGIARYNQAVGIPNTATSGYHETLTVFWAAILIAKVKAIPDPLTAVRAAVAAFGERRQLHQEYYSFDVVNSSEARRRWIPPDRKPIEPE